MYILFFVIQIGFFATRTALSSREEVQHSVLMRKSPMSALRWRYAPIIASHVPKKKMPFHCIFSLTSCHKSVRNVPTLSLHWGFHPILLGEYYRCSPPHHRLLSRALGNQCQTKRNHEGEMLIPNGENRKIFLHSRKSTHTFPFSILTFSAHPFQTLGFSSNFVGRFQNSKGRNRKNIRQNCVNNTSFLHKQALVLKKHPTTQQKPPKITIFKAAENRIILNNFLLVPNTTLNGGVRNANFH